MQAIGFFQWVTKLLLEERNTCSNSQSKDRLSITGEDYKEKNMKKEKIGPLVGPKESAEDQKNQLSREYTAMHA